MPKRKVSKFEWQVDDIVILEKGNVLKELIEFYQEKGGPGSGNWGHAGRPGKRGGSMAGSGGLAKISMKPGSSIGERRGASKKRREASREKKGKKNGAATRNYIDRSSSEEIEKLRSHYNANAQCEAMPPNCQAVYEYTDSEYGITNWKLRGDKAVPPLAKKLDAWIDKAPRVDKNMKIYRQIDPEFVKSATPGTVFQDKGFVSTTVSEKIADRFKYHGVVEGTTRIEIMVPKGSKGAFISDVSALNIEEEEFLLPRNSKFKVLSRKGDERISVELVNG